MLRQGLNVNGELLRDFYVAHKPVNLDCQAANDGMTRQEFAAETDINVLLERYEKTGVLNHYSRRDPLYLDLTEQPIGDLRSALHTLDEATAAFMTLPASVRREFDQDPVKFMEYAGDRSNLEQMREWGLAPPLPAPKEPIEVRVIADPPPAAPPPAPK